MRGPGIRGQETGGSGLAGEQKVAKEWKQMTNDQSPMTNHKPRRKPLARAPWLCGLSPTKSY